MTKLFKALLCVLIASSVIGAPVNAAAPPGAALLDEAAVAREPAVRLAPPAPVGLWGRPFAPEGLSNCDEMAFYRMQWGLPERFDRIGWRESNCRNEDGVRTFCCYGYWQLYVSLHLRDHRLAPLYEACGVSSYSDVNSDIPIDKQRQACAAAALFSMTGYTGWSTA